MKKHNLTIKFIFLISLICYMAHGQQANGRRQKKLALYKEKLAPELYSDVVFYVLPDQFLLYPNPVSQGQNLRIATADAQGEIIEIFDGLGRLILRYDLLSNFESLQTSELPAGIYHYHVLKKGERTQRGKVVIH